MPTIFPLAGFKNYLKITWTDEDADLSRLLDAAEGFICDPENGLMGGPVTMTTFTEEFENLSEVQIRFPDGAEITTVTYTDLDGQTQTLGEIYRLKDDALVLLAGETWPSNQFPVTVTYDAGFESVPNQVIQAGYFYAASLYKANSADRMDADTLRKVLAQMLSGYRRVSV